MPHTIRVKTAPSAMVPDFQAFEGGVMRFVGRRHDAGVGAAGGWVTTDEVVELPFRAEYMQEVHAGALIPQDAESARLCRVPFAGAGVDS